MHTNAKLLLAGAGALALGIAARWAFAARTSPAAPAAPVPTALPAATKQDWAELAAEAPVPEELLQTQRYLEERWGHMPEVGIAALGVDANGDLVVIDPVPKAGRNGQGELIYGLGFYRPRKFTGPVVRYGENTAHRGAMVPLGGAAPGVPGAPAIPPPEAPPPAPPR